MSNVWKYKTGGEEPSRGWEGEGRRWREWEKGRIKRLEYRNVLWVPQSQTSGRPLGKGQQRLLVLCYKVRGIVSAIVPPPHVDYFSVWSKFGELSRTHLGVPFQPSYRSWPVSSVG